MSRRLDTLNPSSEAAARAALADLDAQGVEYFIDSTCRLLIEQQAYFAQGREPLDAVNELRARAGFYLLSESENKHTVTNCDGVNHKSAHQSGDALDVVPMVNGRPIWPSVSSSLWRPIADAFIAQGFTWGGDWDGDGKTRYDGDLDESLVDYPHYERRPA